VNACFEEMLQHRKSLLDGALRKMTAKNCTRRTITPHWTHFTRHFGPLSGIDPQIRKAAERYLLTIFAMGPILPLIYLAVAWLASDKPRELDYVDAEDRRFWQGVRARPANSVRDVRSSFRDIDRRLSDLEVHYTSSNRRLADEIDSLR